MSTRLWRATVATVIGAVAAGCGTASPSPNAAASHQPGASSTMAAGAVPTTVTATTAPPATLYVPGTPQSSPDGAATLLIEAWGQASRVKAAAVASSQAVAALFALPYPGNALQGRGCSETISPATCTYRDASSLIEMDVTRTPAGWYVSSVVAES